MVATSSAEYGPYRDRSAPVISGTGASILTVTSRVLFYQARRVWLDPSKQEY